MPTVKFNNPLGRMRGFLKFAIAAALIIGGLVVAKQMGWIKGRQTQSGVTVGTGKVADINLAKVSGVAALPIPAEDDPVVSPQPGQARAKVEMMSWNSQAGEAAANNGPITTRHSLMAKHGVWVEMAVQNNTDISKDNFITWAAQWKTGKTPDGFGFQIMADGGKYHTSTLNQRLHDIDPNFEAVIFYSPGRSFGEDKSIGLKKFADDPETMRGAVAVGYLGDGDWNLQLAKQGTNRICNNPRTDTYMRECMNWIAADDFEKAADIFIAGKAEQARPVVDKDGKPVRGQNGKPLTTDDIGVRIIPEICVTWTPGDESIFTKMPKSDPRYSQLVTLISTRPGEQSGQMANGVIFLRQWLEANPQWADGFIRATNEGCEQVASNQAWLQLAGRAQAKIYNAHNADYWVKYYKGVSYSAPTGKVYLGGSAVHTLADNAAMFGLDERGNERVQLRDSQYGSVFELFGGYVKANYPKYVPIDLPVEKAVYLEPLKRVLRNQGAGQAAIADIRYEGEIEKVTADTSYEIQFPTGSAVISPSSYPTLETIFRQLNSSDQKLLVIGHADRQGNNSTKNQTLSEQRAASVRSWLLKRSKGQFEAERIESSGKGDSEPPKKGVDPKYLAGQTDKCDVCRRVEFVFGSTR